MRGSGFRLWFGILGLFLWGLVSVRCWSDEGHMIIAAIGYLSLSAEEQHTLNSVFSRWNNGDGYTNPIVAAVWADHMRSSKFVNPESKERRGIIDLFNQWHFVNIPHNPTNIQLGEMDKLYDKREDTASKKLKHIFINLTQPKGEDQYGSYFSYNFLISLFIHIFGDLHQPLHNINFYNSHFPNGDAGGNEIKINYSSAEYGLHRLCDSIFLSRSKSWPAFTDEHAIQQARMLMDMYPASSMGDKLIPKGDLVEFINKISEESNDMAVKHIYSVFDLEKINPQEKYTIPTNNVISIKKMLNERLAVAGYRLGHYFKIIIQNLPKDLYGAESVGKDNNPSVGKTVAESFAYNPQLSLPLAFLLFYQWI